ncbi:outer membrane protein assembly factor BamE [Alexandriicola marinus]|uniref:outer membrane protein assembly factor BamE n=1 Tax=Alexandriicola marinus TaxID=2081710 RepID=UPI001EEF4890|nr:outer membrane protein assembly factor BamE [Alexandriicola marinus]
MVILAGALSIATACAPTFQNHGYIPFEEDLAQIAVGVDTRESVVAAVGSPTSTGVSGSDAFYYVSSRFRHFAFFAPEEINREVLAISFTEAGVVRNIERFGLEDGRVVVLSRRVTDDNLPDTTFLGQLLDNIGNFDPTTLIPEGI